jgi:hypothetical protein
MCGRDEEKRVDEISTPPRGNEFAVACAEAGGASDVVLPADTSLDNWLADDNEGISISRGGSEDCEREAGMDAPRLEAAGEGEPGGLGLASFSKSAVGEFTNGVGDESLDEDDLEAAIEDRLVMIGFFNFEWK